MNEDPKSPGELLRAARLCASAILIGSGVMGCGLAAIAHDAAPNLLFATGYVPAAFLSVVVLLCGSALMIRELRRR